MQNVLTHSQSPQKTCLITISACNPESHPNWFQVQLKLLRCNSLSIASQVQIPLNLKLERYLPPSTPIPSIQYWVRLRITTMKKSYSKRGRGKSLVHKVLKFAQENGGGPLIENPFLDVIHPRLSALPFGHSVFLLYSPFPFHER